MKRSVLLRLIVALVPALVVLCLPRSLFPFEITIVEQRVIALFFLAAFFWVLEPIPVFATSMLIIVLELLMISDKSFFLFARGETAENVFGQILSYKEIMGTMASPILMLFLGGFFLAMAAKKYRLDLTLARFCLSPFGSNPRFVLLGLMLITAFFSMFMSNTATTAMMLAVLMPVLNCFEVDDPGKKAFVLSIPVAANIGGLGTPIGTPPNAVALKYLIGEYAIDFGTWMAFGVPFVLVLLAFAWVLLFSLFRPKADSISLIIDVVPLRTPKAITVYTTCALTVILWLLGSSHGMNSYVVAMIPVAVFTATGIITAEDLKRISWDVLWLVAGGIALGLALESSGAANNIVQAIPFDSLPPHLIIIAATLVTVVMATFMSNTATANLVLPMVAALAASVSSLAPLGGPKMLILVTTISASLAMALPVSTPPNAMAHATGLIEVRDMIKTGVILGVVGILSSYGLMYILYSLAFFN
jgi:sodium-dependent dicarboxylate transporter 2/3/5